MIKSKLILFDIDHTLFDTEKFKSSDFKTYSAYKEIVGVLKKLAKKTELGIFSNGDLEFQKAKLRNTRIDNFFKKQNIYIFQDKILNIGILKKYQNYKIFLVDDRLKILNDAKKCFPVVFTIWIKRGPHAKEIRKIDNFVPDKTITNLRQIYNIIDL